MAKNDRTREFTDAGVSNTRSLREAMGDTDNYRTRKATTGSGNNLTLRTKGGEVQVYGEDDEELYLDNGFVKQGAHGVANTDEEAQYVTTSANATTAPRYTIMKTLKLPFSPKAFKSFFKSFTTRSSAVSAPKPEKISALKEKNRAITNCPPTAFSGMMRRYVAALYGKKVNDAAGKQMTGAYSGVSSTLTYNGVQFTSGVPTTGIVYLASVKKFWMVKLSYTNMVYREMVFSEIGVDVLTKIKPTNTPEQNDILLTYALSEAQVRRNTSGAVEWIDGGTFTEIAGTPLNFGWRFNADGTEATMSTFERVTSVHNDSRRYQASISITENTALPLSHPARFTLSVAVSKVEEVLSWTSNRIKLFQPAGLGKFTWVKTGITDATAVADAPLLSFYDSNNALQVCRFGFTPGLSSSELTGGFTGSVLTPDYQYPTVPASTQWYGWGSGYTYNRETRVAGHGASVRLGSYAKADIRLTDKVDEEFSVSKGVETLIGPLDVSFGQPMEVGYGAYGVNNVANIGNAATWPFTGRVNVYVSPYTWTATARYAGTDATIHTTLFVAPYDNCTAWVECAHTAHGASGVLTGAEPAANSQNQHSYRWVQMSIVTTPGPLYGTYVETGPGNGTIQNPLVNMGYENTATPDEAEGITACSVRNGKGLFPFSTVSNTTGAAPGVFWAATLVSPTIDFDMLTQEDQYSAYTASNILGGSDVSADWPSQTLRSIGWQ